jgi:hypothetical protein
MRHRLFIPAATALLFALSACTQDELADDSRLSKEEYPIVIHATGLSVEATPSTRTTVDGDWVGVNSVALKIGDAVKEYIVATSDADGYKSATLSRENDPYYWISRNPITVSAWWPLDNTDITQMPVVKVAEDQSKLADFQNSDFISAENQTVKFDDPTLGFTHRTARVAIELKPGTGFTSVAGATVSLVSLSADNGNPTAIKTYNASGNTYEALTAPQTVPAGKPFVKVELGGGTFYFRPQNNVVLEAGNCYKYTVKVNTTGLTLEGCTIGSWADGGGESGEAEDLGYNYDSNTKTYTVYNANGLMNVAELVNGGKTDINITLTADIDLTGKVWTPIGTDYDNSYTGTFDGGGHTITGLTVTTNDEYAGLFGYLGNFNNGAATVKNVVMDGIQITCNHRSGYAGGVAGYSWGTIENCSVSGSISGTIYVGGVVGAQRDNPITGCSSSATVKGTLNVGGVAGVLGMDSWEYANLKSHVSMGQYGARVNINLLGLFHQTANSRWDLAVSPHIYAVTTKADIQTIADDAKVMKGSTNWHLGYGADLQVGYQLTSCLKLGIYSGLTRLTGERMDGMPEYQHKNNFLWESGIRLGINLPFTNHHP